MGGTKDLPKRRKLPLNLAWKKRSHSLHYKSLGAKNPVHSFFVQRNGSNLSGRSPGALPPFLGEGRSATGLLFHVLKDTVPTFSRENGAKLPADKAHFHSGQNATESSLARERLGRASPHCRCPPYSCCGHNPLHSCERVPQSFV